MSMLRREVPDTMRRRSALRATGRAAVKLARLLVQPERLLLLGVVGALAAFFLLAFHPQLLECSMLVDSGCGCRSNEKMTRLRLGALASEAYARWSMNNPDQRFPTYIEELTRYLGPDDVRDPWGTRFELVIRPPGHFQGVVSAGADMVFRTADDLHSWDP
jgi:hypothetical protein